MSMMDWNAYHKQVLTGVGDIARISPDAGAALVYATCGLNAHAAKVT